MNALSAFEQAAMQMEVAELRKQVAERDALLAEKDAALTMALVDIDGYEWVDVAKQALNKKLLVVKERGTETTKENDMETLADALPKEMSRVREVLGHYKEIGPAGMFGATFIEQDLRAADAAVMSGDVLAMLQAFETLKQIEA